MQGAWDTFQESEAPASSWTHLGGGQAMNYANKQVFAGVGRPFQEDSTSHFAAGQYVAGIWGSNSRKIV
jgi:hypothetical protein